MTGPTENDRRNAAVRKAIADRQFREYQDAQALATSALGRGWHPWMTLHLLDSDHHRTGDRTVYAQAVKVYRGDKRLTERSLFLRRLDNGLIQVAEQYEDLFPELREPHPTRTLEIGGKMVPAPHFTLCWSALDDGYEPQTAEQLAAARVVRERNREKRADQAYVESSPLLAQAGIRRHELER